MTNRLETIINNMENERDDVWAVIKSNRIMISPK
jgi:hypothetical protein